MARNYLMGGLPAEVRNQIVDEVIVPQPLLLRITNDRPLLGEEPNNLAITQVCRLARQHRDQIRTSTRVRIVACKKSLMYETQRLDRSVLLLDQVKSNVKPGFLTLENHNITEVDLWIGSLAIEPAPESEQPGLSHERGVHTARDFVKLIRQAVNQNVPGLPYSISLCPINVDLQKHLEACRVVAGVKPFGNLVFKGDYKGDTAARKEVRAYFETHRAGLAHARERLAQSCWAQARGDLHWVERRTLDILDELFQVTRQRSC